MQKQLFAYIRVSTPRQGEKGVSLQEQQDAIRNYAQRYGLVIKEWFEERESAAKRGRPVFSKMLKLLRQDKASGVVIHKIDRSARNLKDWADLGELIDAGIDVHFANESLDLHTRGGRLSADIQAVVASDYIRNLREETKKGFYGRLKQGLFPIPAPIGYVDCGKGKPKEPHPVMGSLVAKAFSFYSTGKYSLERLIEEMHRRGLRNRRGGAVSLNGMSTLLNNPFYFGLIRINRTNELFQGCHTPLISKGTFDRVQRVLRGKAVDFGTRHNFTFRRMLRCSVCRYSLIGEQQKGHVYYRCHIRSCPTTTVREESVESAAIAALNTMKLDSEELDYYRTWLQENKITQNLLLEQELSTCRLRLDSIRSRLLKLTDALIDGTIDKRLFDDRKSALVIEEQTAKESVSMLEGGSAAGLNRLEKFLELIESAPIAYQYANSDEKRELLGNLTSNFRVSGKNVVVELKPAAQLVADRANSSNGRPSRDRHRTSLALNHALQELLKFFAAAPPEGV